MKNTSKITLTFLLICNLFSTIQAKAQCTGVYVSDSLELVRLYNEMNGDNWYSSDYYDSWLVGPIKYWHGITLTSDGCSIKEIDLGSDNLSSRIPNLSNLPNLMKLDLSGNNLSGNIPDFNNLPGLINLDLSRNELSGTIPDFSNFPNLINLDLSRNELSGTIPDFSNLPNLISLNLYDNELSDSISDFSNLPNLTELSLYNNVLSGNIPNFSKLPNLTKLVLSQNHLSGNIPDFSNLPNLQSLRIGNNGLSGNIPNFSNLPNLTKLSLNGNNLFGSIPDFSNLSNLINLHLLGNEISGTIPDFSNLPNLTEFSLFGNEISGAIPDFSNLPNLTNLDLSANGLSGSVPNFSNLPKLTNLFLIENELSGTIPNFSNLPNLTNLDLSENNLSGAIPNFSNLPNLESIELYKNNLSGAIPNFSNLPSLESLRLHENALSGSIPDFSNLPSLESLDLSENDFSASLPDFSNLPNLKYFYLNENNLSGSIPDFSNLPNLIRLDLFVNDLSGSIPNFSNLPNLVSLNLRKNNLSGAIPNFNKLPYLKYLKVCPNNLQGAIPNLMFCPLLDVEDIDFSCVKSAQISGYVFYDENANCIKDGEERGIANTFIYTDDKQFFTITDEEGFYVLKMDTGSFTFASSWTSNIWSQTCPESSVPYTATFTSFTDSISNFNYAYEPSTDCPQMEVEIGTPVLTRCFDNTYTVNYCNIGTAIAENAYIELYFPDELIPLNSSIPYTEEDDHLVFDIGELDLFECGSFTVLDSVSCEAVLGSTACIEAFIYPNDPCEIDPIWSRADLTVRGECLDDSVQFIIKNIGANMTSPSQYKLYEDDVLSAFESFQLESGDSIVLMVEATGATFRLTVKQGIGHPAGTTVTEVVEGCGEGPFTFSLVNSQWDGDESSFFDSDCQEIVGSYDPNDKTVYPSGVFAGNHIPDSIDLSYRIRFQNTGNAVAYRVIIIDTIDTDQLQLSSLKLGAYSHDFELDVTDGNILTFTFNDILLPDSSSNEPASHGFITYSLEQKEGNAIDDLITNEAAIYFDYNAPVITNKVFNTVGIPDTTTSDFVYTHVREIPIYENDLLATVNYSSGQMTIQINQLQAGEQFSLELFNILGQEMRFLPTINVPLHQEALPQLQAGIYLYQIRSSKGRIGKGKVLVR